MKKVFASFFAGAVFTAALMLPTVARTAERHPEIRAALGHLQEAKAALQAAKHDFAGHRQKALDATNAAINECNLALQADTK